jgi:hypothetical protein
MNISHFTVLTKKGFKFFLCRIKRQITYIHFHNNRVLAVAVPEEKIFYERFSESFENRSGLLGLTSDL